MSLMMTDLEKRKKPDTPKAYAWFKSLEEWAENIDERNEHDLRGNRAGEEHKEEEKKEGN